VHEYYFENFLKAAHEATSQCCQGETLPCPASEDALREILEAARIDTTAFGVGKAKSIVALLDELKEGSCRLRRDASSGKVCRLVEPVFVQILHAGNVIVERSQVLPNGKRRDRNTLLGEKLDPTDRHDAFTSALRGIKEELKVDIPQQLPQGMRRCVEHDLTYTQNSESFSYPGIQATYITHMICLEILPDSPAERLFANCGLPAGTPFETTEAKTEGTLRLQWSWVSREEAIATKVKGWPPA
jgi:hypothetical protein